MELMTISMDALLQTSAPNDSDSNADFDAASRLLVQAFERDGMAYLHFGEDSMPRFRTVVDGAFDASLRFFAQSFEEKRQVTPGNLPPGVSRGYVGVAAEGGGEATELKEAFSWSVGDDDTEVADTKTRGGRPRPLEHENVWPAKDDGMRVRFETLLMLLQDTMQAVGRAVAHGCGADAALRNLEQQCRDGVEVSFARALHYLPQPCTQQCESDDKGDGGCDDGTGATGSTAHTDWGLATLVLQEVDSHALQALTNGQCSQEGVSGPAVWNSVRGVRDTLVVNCSDYVALASGGRLKSPVHRVVLTGQRRLSFVYFQYPPFDTPFPELGRVPGHVVRSVSLLKDQRSDGCKGRDRHPGNEDDESDTKIAAGLSFGEFIARKWVEVLRPVGSR